MTDLLATEGLEEGVFALVDVDAPRLEPARQIGQRRVMLDPLTAAVCSLEEIDRLFEEMWVAERESLTAFS
jgi:alpha-galactosidase/6-phospho-beta-glucosidase family protein